MQKKCTNFSPGLYVAPGARKEAYRDKGTKKKDHSRLRHGYEIWHPDHLKETEKLKGNKIPFEDRNSREIRSRFDSTKIIDDAVQKSNLHHAYVSKERNFVIVFNIGYLAGYCERTQRNTSCVTVVTDQCGEVITAYPGNNFSKKVTA